MNSSGNDGYACFEQLINSFGWRATAMLPLNWITWGLNVALR
jgi:hypothetical protein